MSLATAYYIVLLLWAVLGLWSTWPNLRAGGPNLILFLLLLILGWHEFGTPIHG